VNSISRVHCKNNKSNPIQIIPSSKCGNFNIICCKPNPESNKCSRKTAVTCKSLYGANILSTGRNRGLRLPEIIVDDTSQNILPFNQTFCTPLRA
jgi:hypothetical protein